MADQWPVTFCGILMDGTPDANGVRWMDIDLDGWDSPPVRSNDASLTGRHGGYGSARLYDPRPLTLSGTAECADMAAAFAVRRRLMTMPGTDAAVLTVHEDVSLSVDTVLDGNVRASWPIDVPNPYVIFQIPLLAHDPFKRGAAGSPMTVNAGTSPTVPNGGTAPADMVVTLDTAGTVVLSAGGVTLTTAALPAGAVIDTAATTVKDSTGGDLFTLVSLPPLWPTIPAGGGPVSQLGTANLSVVHFDTYA